MRIGLLTAASILAVLSLSGCEPSYTSDWKPVTRSQLVGNYVSNMEPVQTLTLSGDGVLVHEFDVSGTHYADTSRWRFGAGTQPGRSIMIDSARCFRYEPYSTKLSPYFTNLYIKCGMYKRKAVIAIEVTDVEYYFVKGENGERLIAEPRRGSALQTEIASPCHRQGSQ